MTSWASEGAFRELVTAVVEADDPSLLQRACVALGAILTEYSDSDDTSA